MEPELITALRGINERLDKHASDSSERERRSITREQAIVNQISTLTTAVRTAQDRADAAHAEAVAAKHAAGRISIDTEGTIESVYSKMTALDGSLAEHRAMLESHAGDLDRAKKAKAKEMRVEKLARAFWRVAGPALTALLLALLQHYTGILTGSAPPANPPPAPTHVAP